MRVCNQTGKRRPVKTCRCRHNGQITKQAKHEKQLNKVYTIDLPCPSQHTFPSGRCSGVSSLVNLGSSPRPHCAGSPTDGPSELGSLDSAVPLLPTVFQHFRCNLSCSLGPACIPYHSLRWERMGTPFPGQGIVELLGGLDATVLHVGSPCQAHSHQRRLLAV